MGRESYSPEAYRAVQDEQQELERASDNTTRNAENRRPGDPFREHFFNRGKEFAQRAMEAKRRLSKLMASGHAEANELNKQYDQLLAESERAERALRGFETEKLGMSPEQEPNEEAA